MSDTLNVYALVQHPLRSTVSDHLYSLRRYGRGRQFYINVAVRSVPDWIRKARFDAVVYHTTFFSTRYSTGQFEEMMERAAPLKETGRVRVALPQDEYLRPGLLRRFVGEFGIDHVFTLAGESEWPKIYAGVDSDRVGFSTVLPGYLSDDTRERIERILARNPARPIDIGYRAWKGAPWLGRHGLLKDEVGGRVKEAGGRHGLVTDISNRASDVHHGDDWFRFLASCRYTIGVEGGASLLDESGDVKERVDRYLAEHPGAGFDEVEAACFPGEDGRLEYFAIGPRHIEACATRTCQILVEGHYQGVLSPGRHYLELKRDYSNLDQVLEQTRDEELRERLTASAYEDVIASGRYTYEELVRQVEEVTLSGRAARAPQGRAPGAFAHAWARLAERLSWIRVLYRLHVGPRVPHPVPHWMTPYMPLTLFPNVYRRLRRALMRRPP